MSKQYLDELYLAYGSNVSLSEMGIRCPDSEFVGITELKGHKLKFMGFNDIGYLNVVKHSMYNTTVVAYKVTQDDLIALDYYEGYPNLYTREYTEVTILGKTYKAFYYVMNDEYSYTNKYGIECKLVSTPQFPSMSYLIRCVDGYKIIGMNPKPMFIALYDMIADIELFVGVTK